MTRRRVLTDAQIRVLHATHQPGVRGFGYGALAKLFNVGESTVRDAIQRYTACSARL